MPRIRSVKPEFWKSEKLAARLPGPDGRQARLLFIALWNFCEDHGVVRGRAAYVRAEVFPYEEDVSVQDVERWLLLLERGGFITRYVVADSTYIHVRGFSEHQRIEKPSKPTLPLPPAGASAQPPAVEPSALLPAPLPEASPTPPGALPVGYGDGDGGETEGEVEREGGGAARGPRPEDLQSAWNAFPQLPRWKSMTPARRKSARARLRERALDGPEGWSAVVARIAASSFCLGGGRDGWRADPDWLLKPDTAAKVLEGKYDDRGGPAAAGPPPRPMCAVGACRRPNDGEVWGQPLCLPHQAALRQAFGDAELDEHSVARWVDEQDGSDGAQAGAA